MITEAIPKKKWQKVNGIVLLNKPEKITSNGLLQQVRRLYSAEKAGHTGALDPFATGLLPICLGEATKISGLLLDSDKAYIATLKLGEATDTADRDGEVVKIAPVSMLSEGMVEKVLNEFLGETTQIPPMYSALKFQGKPLYEYARKGIEIERPARKVVISQINLLALSASEIQFEVYCSKGTYVRTLGEDIAVKLGTVGHLIGLHRTQTGALTAQQMHTLEAISEDKETFLYPLDLPLQHLQALYLTEEQTHIIQHGGKLELEEPTTEIVRFYSPEGLFFGVGEWQVEKQLIKPKRLFNL
jgi:tRNA pseudouridine55 synthase